MTNVKRKLTKEERAAYALVGRVGGRAIFKKLGKKGMSSLGAKGAEARWKKVDQAGTVSNKKK